MAGRVAGAEHREAPVTPVSSSKTGRVMPSVKRRRPMMGLGVSMPRLSAPLRRRASGNRLASAARLIDDGGHAQTAEVLPPCDA